MHSSRFGVFVSVLGSLLFACGVDPLRDELFPTEPDGSTVEGTDAATFESGPTGSPKICNGENVLESDPRYGCGASTCDPCTSIRSISVCARAGAASVCAIGKCDRGWDSCDSNPRNGCETNLLENRLHCGACGAACKDAEVCSAGRCKATCDIGLSVCALTQGGSACIDSSTSVDHCGVCNNACPAPKSGASTCTTGKCGVTCAVGARVCASKNACEAESETSCGPSCSACPASNNGNGNAVCRVGAGIGNGSCELKCVAGYEPDGAGGCKGTVAVAVLRNTLELGYAYGCSITPSGILKCWGRNNKGQLGIGNTVDHGTPMVVPLSDVAQVSAGFATTCAVTQSGNVKCWGDNQWGQIGSGLPKNESLPVDIGLSNVVQISVGYLRTCAVTNTGGVKCWGVNADGTLGIGTKINQRTPADVPVNDAVQIASRTHTCVVTRTGSVKCWGPNNRAAVGNGTTSHVLVPVDLGLTDVVQVVTGNEFTCARTRQGSVKCWGDVPNRSPLWKVPTDFPISKVTQLAAGESHVCALLQSGGVTCWGSNGGGELGNGTTSLVSSPPVDVAIAGVGELAAGYGHSCASLGTAVKCWGTKIDGLITFTSQPTPAIVPGLP